MVPHLNDIEAWNRQGERYLREARNKPPVHPGVASSGYARAGAAGERAPASRSRKEALSAAR